MNTATRYNKPITPFQFNLIGNSSAHPAFAPSRMTVKTTFNDHMRNDDFFCSNHLFFDDCSFSPGRRSRFPAATRRPSRPVRMQEINANADSFKTRWIDDPRSRSIFFVRKEPDR